MKKYGYAYVLLTVVCLVVLIGHFVSSHGEYARYFFWRDEADTGMDFVNCLGEAVGGEPYSKYRSSYPPVASSYFYALQTMLPDDVKTVIPRTHNALVRHRRTPFDLRTHQSVLMLLILHSVLSVMLILCAVIYKFRSYGALPAMAIGFAAVSSYGCLSALERGNIVLLATGLLMIYLLGYDSPDRRVRILSYACLVLSSCIKLYPAIFALMLFDGRRHRKDIAMILSGMALSGSLLSITAFNLFRGLADAPVFLHNLLCFNSGSSNDLMYRYGMRGIADHFLAEFYKRTGITLPHPNMIASVMFASVLLSLLFSLYVHFHFKDETYQEAFDITLIAVLLQTNSNDYTLCLFIPVLLMFIHSDPSPDLKGTSYYAFLLVFVLPYYTPVLSDPINLTVHHVDIIQLTLLLSTGFELIIALSELSSRSHHHSSWRPPHMVFPVPL